MPESKNSTEMLPLLEGSSAARGPLCLLGGDLQDPRKAGNGENFSLGELDSITACCSAPDFFLLYNEHHLLKRKARMTMQDSLWLKMPQMEDPPVILKGARNH